MGVVDAPDVRACSRFTCLDTLFSRELGSRAEITPRGKNSAKWLANALLNFFPRKLFCENWLRGRR
jgi:hypothetical protein